MKNIVPNCSSRAFLLAFVFVLARGVAALVSHGGEGKAKNSPGPDRHRLACPFRLRCSPALSILILVQLQ
jgi:hypothetical protein